MFEKGLPCAAAGPAYTAPVPQGAMRGARWFEGALLNFAENLMPERTEFEVLICLSEGSSRQPRRYTGNQLWHEVSSHEPLQQPDDLQENPHFTTNTMGLMICVSLSSGGPVCSCLATQWCERWGLRGRSAVQLC